MVNYSTNVLKDVWVAISDNKDYVLQNKGTGSILVKASDTMPTDAVGAIEVQGKKWITSKELYGKVWCSATMEVQQIAYGIGDTVSSGGGSGVGTTIDREVVVTTYTCKTAFTGASVGDTITATQIIDVTGAPVTVSTVWRNQSTGTDLSSAPSSANLMLAGAGIGLTDAQLRATPLVVTGGLTDNQLRANPVPVGQFGDMIQVIPDVTPATFATYYNVNLNGGDALIIKPTSNGQLVTALSMNPLVDNHESSIYLQNLPKALGIPHVLGLEASMSQRVRGQFAVMEVVNSDSLGVAPTVASYPIATIQQVTTTLTITFATAVNIGGAGGVGLNIGDWIDVSGVTSDNRLNYSNLCINTISADGKTITCTYADDVAIPSISVGPFSQGTVTYRPQLGAATAGYGMRFSSTSAGTCAYISQFGGYEVQVSGSLNTSHMSSCSSTAPVFAYQSNGHYDVKASTKFWVKSEPQSILFYDLAVDTSTVAGTRTYRSGVKPDFSETYGVRFRVVSPKSMSRPIARIASISKAGTTTTTVNTTSPHGLVTGNFVTIKGVLDQTNFAGITTPTAVTVVNDTRFTIVHGSAATATSYGGTVVLTNCGGVDQQGVVSQVIQSVARDVNGIYTFVGNSTWGAPAAVGEYVNIHGLISNTGTDLGLDGVYEIMNLSGTTMLAKPVQDYTGTYLATNSTNVINTTACGGTVILRTTLRSHDTIGYTYKQSMVQIDGQGTVDATKAVPMYSTGGVVYTLQSTAATISTSTGLGGWYTHPAITGILDVASAALTSTSTSAAIANNLGNGFQVNIAVTAVSGTTPTMDVRIEESFDGGTNWVTLYEMQRITAMGSYNTPILRASGRHIRYVRTVTGTSPSFTNAVTRNVLPSIPAEPQKRLMDRSIVLTTLNSVTPTLFSGAANNVQLVVNIGTATTAPVLQLEGSEDGTNWYALGTPLTAVASSTVQLTVNEVSATFARARVSTAGATVVAGYVSIKAWS